MREGRTVLVAIGAAWDAEEASILAEVEAMHLAAILSGCAVVEVRRPESTKA